MKDPNQPEFMQAAEEVLVSILPVLKKQPEYVDTGIVERINEPERIRQYRHSALCRKKMIESREQSNRKEFLLNYL